MKITIVIMQNFYMVLACPVCLLEKKMKKFFFIAEAGVNHNNKIKLAYRLIDAAKLAGADAIKFQVLKQKIMSLRKHLSLIIKKNTKQINQYRLIKKLELSESNLEKLLNIVNQEK